MEHPHYGHEVEIRGDPFRAVVKLAEPVHIWSTSTGIWVTLSGHDPILPKSLPKTPLLPPSKLLVSIQLDAIGSDDGQVRFVRDRYDLTGKAPELSIIAAELFYARSVVGTCEEAAKLRQFIRSYMTDKEEDDEHQAETNHHPDR